MKRLITLLLIVVIASLTVASTASGHNTRWYWNRYMAESELIEYGLEWTDEVEGDYTDEVLDARCYGYGPSMRLKNGTFGFKHFRCKIDTPYEQYWIRFHVINKYYWDYEFLSYVR